jgi:hypothetical protein
VYRTDGSQETPAAIYEMTFHFSEAIGFVLAQQLSKKVNHLGNFQRALTSPNGTYSTRANSQLSV